LRLSPSQGIPRGVFPFAGENLFPEVERNPGPCVSPLTGENKRGLPTPGFCDVPIDGTTLGVREIIGLRPYSATRPHASPFDHPGLRWFGARKGGDCKATRTNRCLSDPDRRREHELTG